MWRRAGDPGLIVEQVIRPAHGPLPSTLFDLNMLVLSEEGRDRSADDDRIFLNQAVLLLSQTVLPLPGERGSGGGGE